MKCCCNVVNAEHVDLFMKDYVNNMGTSGRLVILVRSPDTQIWINWRLFLYEGKETNISDAIFDLWNEFGFESILISLSFVTLFYCSIDFWKPRFWQQLTRMRCHLFLIFFGMYLIFAYIMQCIDSVHWSCEYAFFSSWKKYGALQSTAILNQISMF